MTDTAIIEQTDKSQGSGRAFGLSGYQWAVLFAAWLGWGFDVFDGLLFNWVAPNCIPVLLHLTSGSEEAKNATALWTGIANSVLLVGWAIGGIVFGKIADRIGRSKTLMLTILLYAFGTAACALAPSIGVLLIFRFIASLGIGGEWAAGASLVAEVVPEKRRVECGALLYTSAPAGLFLATYINGAIATSGYLKDNPELSWRYILACGLIPAAFAFVVRFFIKEPERWKQNISEASRARIGELFLPENIKLTISGFIPAVTILITWWSCNVFVQFISSGLAKVFAHAHGFNKPDTLMLAQHWTQIGSNWFTIGGLIGTLLTIPAAKFLGRRVMFGVYFGLGGLSILYAFGHPWPYMTQLFLFFPIGLTVFGVFGSFTYYLPELFPTRLRATGAGFCYNSGRFIAAIGPFVIGAIASQHDALAEAMRAIFYLGFVPLIGLLFLPWVIETRGKTLRD